MSLTSWGEAAGIDGDQNHAMPGLPGGLLITPLSDSHQSWTISLATGIRIIRR
jgi:hypothetical protein